MASDADINECAVDNGGCHVNAECRNTEGGRECRCNDGFDGDGERCADINECAVDNGGCDVNAECRNTEGGRECRCNAGFDGDGGLRTSTSVPWITVAAI